MYNSDDDIIHLSLSQSEKIYLFSLDSGDGSTSSIHTADGFSQVLDSYLVDSDELFISATDTAGNYNYIFIYHFSNASFTQYKYSDANLQISSFAYSSGSSRIVFYGGKNDYYLYSAHTISESILDLDGISEDTTQILSEANASDYQLTSNSYNVTNNDGRQFFSHSSISIVSRKRTIDVDTYRDLVYYVDAPTDSDYFSLMEGWTQTLSIDLTCSVLGTLSLEQQIIDYDTYTAPTWVTLDDVNNELTCSMPKVEADTNYYFQIKTNEIGSSISYYRLVNLTVLN